MLVTDPKSLGTLVTLHVTSTSAVLMCELKHKVIDLAYWEIYLDGEFLGTSHPQFDHLDGNVLYYRLTGLDRLRDYTASVIAVDKSDRRSAESNVIGFKTFPK